MIAPLAALAAVCTFAAPAQTNAPAEVKPGADGLIHLQAKPEMVALIPTLSVANMKRAVEFYGNKLGFELVLQSGNYVALGRNNIQLGFVPDKNPAKGYKPSLYIQMVRIDDFYKEVTAAGVKPASEIKTSASNMREFSLDDPDGYHLIFGEYIGPK
ncbi:MAG: VOC family protein [Verrucomicrobiae bacterium]